MCLGVCKRAPVCVCVSASNTFLNCCCVNSDQLSSLSPPSYTEVWRLLLFVVNNCTDRHYFLVVFTNSPTVKQRKCSGVPSQCCRSKNLSIITRVAKQDGPGSSHLHDFTNTLPSCQNCQKPSFFSTMQQVLTCHEVLTLYGEELALSVE